MLAKQKNSALLFKNPLLASSSAASARDLKSLCKNMLFGQYFLCIFLLLVDFMESKETK